MGNNPLVRFWVSSSMRDFHVALAVLAIGCQLIGRLSQNAALPVAGDVITLLGILHFFVHGYFHRQQQFLINNMRTYSLPKKKIARTGTLFLCVFLLLVCIGMAIVRELYSGTLLAKLKALFVYVFGGILTALFGTGGLGSDSHIIQNNNDLLGTMNQIAAKSDSPWESVINVIQTVLIIIGVILLIVLTIVAAVNYIRRLFAKAAPSAKKAMGSETQDREESLYGTTARREKLIDFSPSAKIRRLYRRSINRQRRKGQVMPDWMTPTEIETHVSMPEGEQYRELHEIYEKARYSGSGADENDARRVKDLGI